jgi:hypothetical protein
MRNSMTARAGPVYGGHQVALDPGNAPAFCGERLGEYPKLGSVAV